MSPKPEFHDWDGLYYDASRTTHVVARCTCGWRGLPRRPEQEGGNVKPWVEDWRQHRDKVRARHADPPPP